MIPVRKLPTPNVFAEAYLMLPLLAIDLLPAKNFIGKTNTIWAKLTQKPINKTILN